MNFSSKDQHPEIIFRNEREGISIRIAYADGPTAVKTALNSLHIDEISQSEAIKTEKRKDEYIISRWLARELLGVKSPILRGDRSPPKWPDGTRGSISHKNGIAAVAVVSPFTANSYVGIDIEREDSVGVHLDRSILTPGDTKLIASLPSSDHPKARAIIFSFKESLYKALNPIESVFFWFEHASVEKIDLDSGVIVAKLNKDITKLHKTGTLVHGFFHTISHHNQNYILTIARTSYP